MVRPQEFLSPSVFKSSFQSLHVLLAKFVFRFVQNVEVTVMSSSSYDETKNQEGFVC